MQFLEHEVPKVYKAIFWRKNGFSNHVNQSNNYKGPDCKEEKIGIVKNIIQFGGRFCTQTTVK